MNRLTSTFKEETSWKPFLLSMVFTGLSYGIYKGIIDNYLAEVVQMTEFDKGLSEFFREMPGALLVFLLAIFYTCSAEKLYKVGAVIVFVGIACHGLVPPTKVMMILAILMFSTGEHIQLGMKNSLTVEYSKPGKSGEALGYMNSSNQIGHVVGYIVIPLAFSAIAGEPPFKLFFMISAAIAGISVAISFFIKGNTKQDETNSRFYFRKKFFKYYMLEIFYGARKQVFFTFGPYVLILFYKADTVIISTLFAISAIAGFVMAPVIGHIIDKAGYRIVMIMDTLILLIVCFFYGFAHHIFPEKIAFIICCINYILDSVISLASMASNVYVQDISDSPEECRATISTGISVNHLITILIALFGGWIWQKLGMETLFIISAVLGICNSIYAATIPKKPKEA